MQNNGRIDECMEAAIKLARDKGITVCDVYSKRKQMSVEVVNVTDLLINDINYPKHEMHMIFTDELYKTILVCHLMAKRFFGFHNQLRYVKT